VSYTSITDEMLAPIAGMTNLTSLSLRCCRALLGDVPQLAEMKLTHLDMSRTNLQSALPHIAKITSMRSLNLSESLINSLGFLKGALLHRPPPTPGSLAELDLP
jgi:Leucine-rich repeat (LRR) protein